MAEEKVPREEQRSGRILTSLAFMLIGADCGWFLTNAIFNLLANERETQRGGKTYGIISIGGGLAALSCSAFYMIYKKVSRPDSLETLQLWTSSLLVFNILFLAFVTAFWPLGAPVYPVVPAVAIVGQVLGYSTSYVLYPMIATHYAGWLVAPIRFGSDLTTLLTGVAAELQNPSGSQNRFPSWVLLLGYTAMSLLGLLAWAYILTTGMGLREKSLPGPQLEEKRHEVEAEALENGVAVEAPEELSARSPLAAKSVPNVLEASATQGCFTLCPRRFRLPMILVTLVQVLQWGFALNLGEIGASMADPTSCAGSAGAWIYRTSLTTSWFLLPVGSLMSLMMRCPRLLFNCSCMLQIASAVSVTFAALGIFRAFWMSHLGQMLYIAASTLAAGLEGFTLTAAYRYIGDDEDLTAGERQRLSDILGMLSVIPVCAAQLVVGWLIERGTIECVAP